MGRFPIIVSKSVVLLSTFTVKALQMFFFVTAALHVVHLQILLCSVWITWSGFTLLFHNAQSKTVESRKQQINQEQQMNKHIKNLISERWSNLLGTMTPNTSSTTWKTDHQGTHQRDQGCTRHPDASNRIGRHVGCGQGPGPTRHTCHGMVGL